MQAHSVIFSEGSSVVKIVLNKNNKSLTLRCSPDQYLKGIIAYRTGALLQDAFSFLNQEEREFLVSGIIPKEPKKLFSYG